MWVEGRVSGRPGLAEMEEHWKQGSLTQGFVTVGFQRPAWVELAQGFVVNEIIRRSWIGLIRESSDAQGSEQVQGPGK